MKILSKDVADHRKNSGDEDASDSLRFQSFQCEFDSKDAVSENVMGSVADVGSN